MADTDPPASDEPAAPVAGTMTPEQQAVFDALPPAIQSDPKVRRKYGLGDIVEIAVSPIARVLGIKNCPKCKDRRDRLNNAFRRR